MRMHRQWIPALLAASLFASGCYTTHPWCRRWCAPRPATAAAVPPPGTCGVPGTAALPSIPAGTAPVGTYPAGTFPGGPVGNVPGGPVGTVPAFNQPANNGFNGFNR